MTQDQTTSMSFSLMTGWWFILVLFIQAGQFNCQSPEGYLNIDCGLASSQSYIDDTTRLEYVSDDQFVQTGRIYNISETYTINRSMDKQYLSLRSFPNGSRNCYVIKPMVPSGKYLVRASFLYRNYDGLNSVGPSSHILFDLYIGINLWDTVNITNASQRYQYELITVVSSDFMSICLINTGSGTPFISLIETRQLNATMYMAANSSQSLKLIERSYLAKRLDPIIRYPDDAYDRIWNPWFVEEWHQWHRSDHVEASTMFEVPSYVLQFAASNITTTKGSIYFKREYPQIDKRYLFLHSGGIAGHRTFNVYLDNILLAGPIFLASAQSTTVDTPEPSITLGFEVLMEATSDSTSEPLLSALEVYSLATEAEVATDEDDFNAIMKIKQNYTVKKNWMGDPCSPKNYTWDGVGCKYTARTPIIISLNLSSSSLNGSISDSFFSLKSIQILDLSNNRLSGDVPDSLANMPSLQVL
ncbi:hypothetical protein LUZ60_006699 [Juncus effusus]|nr:hypothetical protein LUZ60_006699 [Juncus effusus]